MALGRSPKFFGDRGEVGLVLEELLVPLGRYSRMSPPVFSLLPRSHGECGCAKYTGMLVTIVNAA